MWDWGVKYLAAKLQDEKWNWIIRQFSTPISAQAFQLNLTGKLQDIPFAFYSNFRCTRIIYNHC